jgi:hypothetical protein
MGLDLKTAARIIDQVTEQQGLRSDRSTALLLATAAHESHLGTYLYQIGGGPARGLFGMELATEKSIWSNYLKYKMNHRKILTAISGVVCPHPYNNEAMVYNLAYQICMARLYYWQAPEPLPNPFDMIGQCKYWAEYWKRVNVSTGDEADFIDDYIKYLGEIPKWTK